VGINRLKGLHIQCAEKRTWASRHKIWGKVIGGGLLSLLILASSAASNPRRIAITATRYSFEPAEITVKPGEPIDLVLTSTDVPHGVKIRELNLDLKASKGKPGEAKFTPDKPGTFVGHCSVFCGSGHGRMTLTIHVAG
jgi:cytochrome c oxidase subunit 2